MDASKAFRPIGVVAATAVLLTGVACGGAPDRVASRRAGTSAPATTVVAPSASAPAPAAAAGTPSGPSVRTDDLEADLKQADSQLTQTSTAVSDADQNTQQLND